MSQDPLGSQQPEARLRQLETRADRTDERLRQIELFLKLAPQPEPVPVPVDPSPTPVPVDPTPNPVPVDPTPIEPVPTQPPVDPAPIDPVPTPTPVDPVPTPSPVDPVPTPVPVEPTPTPLPTPRPEPRPEPRPQPTPSQPGTDHFGKIIDLLGKYGLAVAGSLLLAVVAVWGLNYVYDQVGPEVKLAAGGLFAAALVVFGERSSRNKQLAWWSQAIIGAGYSIAYFVGYAAHNVAGLQVITDPVTDSALLLALTAIGGFHAVWRNSQPIALLSVLLAFVTISLSSVTYFSVVASGLMLLGLVTVIARQKWYGVYVVGSVAAYATFMVFTQPQVMASSATALAGLMLSAAFLFTYWLAFNAVALLLKPNGQAQKSTILAVVIGNAVAFLLPTMYQLGNQFPELRWAFLAIIGTLYLASAAIAGLRKDRILSGVMLVTGLQLVTAAVPLKLDGNAVTAVWLLETLGLTVLGMRYGMPVLRVFGLVVAVACGVHMGLVDMQSAATFDLAGYAVPTRSLIGLVAMFASAVSYGLYVRGKFERYSWETAQIPQYLFYCATVALGWLLPLLDAPHGAIALIWSAEALLVVLASRFVRDVAMPKTGILFIGSSLMVSLLFVGAMSQTAIVLACATPFVIGLIYRFNLVSASILDSAILRQVYFAAGTAMMLSHTYYQNPTPEASLVPFAIEASVLVAAGFVLRDQALRVLGGLGLAVTVGMFAFGMTATWATSLMLVGVLSAAAIAYRVLAASNYTDIGLLWQDERKALTRWYPVAASVLLAVTFLNSDLMPTKWAPVALAAESVTLVALGIGTRAWVLRTLGFLAFATSAVSMCSHINDWSWVTNLTVVTSMVLTGLVYRKTRLQPDADGLSPSPEGLEQERTFYSHVYTSLAALLLGGTFLQLLDAAVAPLALALEAGVLTLLGLRFGDTILRLLGSASIAAASLCMLGHVDSWSWGVNLPVVAVMALSAVAYRYFKPGRENDAFLPSELVQAEPRIMREVYPVLASLFLGGTFLQLLSAATAPLALALEIGVLALVGLRYSNTVSRLLGVGGTAVTAIFMLNHVDAWTWAVNAPVVAILAGVAVAYRFIKPNGDEEDSFLPANASVSETLFSTHAYPLVATLVLALTSFYLLASGVLPFAWALQGALLLAIGFRYRELPMLGGGLMMFTVLIGKLLIYDLHGASEGVRILSWLGAAVLALLGARAFWLYDWRKPSKEKPDGETKAVDEQK